MEEHRIDNLLIIDCNFQYLRKEAIVPPNTEQSLLLDDPEGTFCDYPIPKPKALRVVVNVPSSKTRLNWLTPSKIPISS